MISGKSLFFIAPLVGLFLCLLVAASRGHDWYPYNCCSGADCRPLGADAITTTPEGFFVKESGETIAYTSDKIKQTPPEGGGLYHRCSRDGKPEAETICLYIPNWGT